MSKVINIDARQGATVVLKNKWTPEAEDAALALKQLQTVADDDVFNTGFATLGDPHVDAKYDADTVGKPVIKDRNPWHALHVASVRLYRSNSYVYLLPGDTLKITVDTAEAAAYYATLRSDLLDVDAEQDVVEVTDEDHPEVEFDAPPYLDRTTGIGDDGAINFDSEGVTEEMTTPSAEEEGSAEETDSDEDGAPDAGADEDSTAGEGSGSDDPEEGEDH